MPRIVTNYQSTTIILPFERRGIERRQLGMAPRTVMLAPLDADLQEMASRPQAHFRLGPFIVAPAIENDLLVKLRVGGCVCSNGLISASLLKQRPAAYPPGARRRTAEDLVAVTLEVSAEKDLMLDCGLLASVVWAVEL